MRQRDWRAAIACVCAIAALPTAAQQPVFDPAKTKLVILIPKAETVTVAENVVFKSVDGANLAADVYMPSAKGPQPAIVLVSGAPSVRAWGLYKDYGRLLSQSGFVAVVPDKRFQQGAQGLEQGTQDTLDLLAHLRKNAEKYRIDAGRICLWTFSAGGSLAHLGLQPENGFACVVSYYGLGQAGPTIALRSSAEKMPPTLVVRAGRDNPVLNNAIDVFMQTAVALNAPVTFINYPGGLHAFEVEDLRAEVTQPANIDGAERILGVTIDWIRAQTRRR
jgi:dienelactone hydrolase